MPGFFSNRPHHASESAWQAIDWDREPCCMDEGGELRREKLAERIF
jgi:hypothetical protein